MPNLETLSLVNANGSDGFLLPNPDGPNSHTKLPPSLRRLYLRDAGVEIYHDWSPLVHYVTHQTSDNRPFSLVLVGERTHVCLEVGKEIEGLDEEFVYNRNARPTFCKCSRM